MSLPGITTTTTVIIIITLLQLPHPTSGDNHSGRSKRGLIHIASEEQPADERTLSAPPTALSWYYNYGSKPTPAIDSLEFVPMLWGAPSPSEEHYNFTTDVLALIRGQSGTAPPVRAVLGFNEPDMPRSVGGSDMAPALAADLWRAHIQPLAGHDAKLGAPAVASTPQGKAWLAEFFEKCADCSVDFIPLHWYGNFEGLASYVGEMRQAYPDKELWVTEMGFPFVDLAQTYGFFNTATEYLDRLDDVARYAWFGSFRSAQSNVGPNAAMLDDDGALTDLGAWYLGRKATGNTPDSSGAGRVAAAAALAWTAALAVVAVVVVVVAVSV